MRCRLFVALLSTGLLFLAQVAGAATVRFCLAGETAGTCPTADRIGIAAIGETVNIDIVLDTGGLSFEGYSYDIDITTGTVSSIGLTHASLSPLIADLLGPFVIDDAADTIDNINQGTLSTGLPPGDFYIIDTLSFVVETLPVDGALVIALLGPGDTFGLGGGNVTPTFFTTLTIVPEPGTALIFGAGIFGLAVMARRQKA